MPARFSRAIYRSVCIITLFSGLVLSNHTFARFIAPAKTPEDNYSLTTMIHHDLSQLYQLKGQSEKEPQLNVTSTRHPRHVYQKALEVLTKVNRFRQINDLGPIATPDYPARLITPDEVHGLVSHLKNEIHLLIPENARRASAVQSPDKKITPTDVYISLKKASLRMDPLLGVRGYTPNEVYQLAEYILNQVQFLRLNQNLKKVPVSQKRTSGKHSNHALAAAYELQDKIFYAQGNLWMPSPEKPPEIPRRVISPTDVFDALQVIQSELQRIKYRLGIDRKLPMPPLQKNKTPDDVIMILNQAKALMPLFDETRSVLQYDNRLLDKTPDDTFQEASKVLHMLKSLNQARGVAHEPEEEDFYQDISPGHVFQATLHNLRRTNELRKQTGFAPSNIPELPLRTITPTDVFEIVVRLRKEIEIFFAATGFHYTPAQSEKTTGKTPEDVFRTMRKIHQQMGVLTGRDSTAPETMAKEALHIIRTLFNIYKHLNIPLPAIRTPAETTEDKQHQLNRKALLTKTHSLLELTDRIRARAGSFVPVAPGYTSSGKADYSVIYANISQVHDELIAIKPHLGIFRTNHTTSIPFRFQPGDHKAILNDLQNYLDTIEIYLKVLAGPNA